MLCDSGVHVLDLIEGTQFLPGALPVDARSRQREGRGRRGGFEELGHQRKRVPGEAT
jgi:hypothetical protein